jgi:hypothetical protein
MKQNNSQCQTVARYILLIIVTTLCVVSSVYFMEARSLSGTIKSMTSTDSQPYSEAIKNGITHSSEAGKNIAQTLLLMLAALWGLIIAKKDERKIAFGDLPETLMLLLSNIIIGECIYVYSIQQDTIGNILSRAQVVDGKEYIIDLGDMHLADFYDHQVTLCIIGSIATAITLFSAHLLSRSTKE